MSGAPRAMRVGATLVALASLVCGCGPRAPAPLTSAQGPLSVSIEGFPERTVLGAPFEFVVQRAWTEPYVPDPLAPEAFAPLVVARLGATRATRDGATVELQRLRAHALGLGRVATAPLVFAAADGATRVRVEHAPLVVEVAGVLASDDASRAELGLAPLGPRSRSAWFAALALAVLAGATLVVARRRAVGAPTAAPEPPPAPAASRTELLAALLADLAVPGRGEAEHYDALVGAVRAGLAVLHGRDLAHHTAHELAALVRSPALRAALARGERVRFAGEVAGAAALAEDTRRVSAALRHWCAGAAEDERP